MRRIVLVGVYISFCLLGALFSPYVFISGNQIEGSLICKLCNLSIPFHGCLLDFGTCRTKPGQYCIKENHFKGGIQWYTIKGCTESSSQCFKRTVSAHEIHSTHCCSRSMCNF
ncbi:uncharacterized protein C9orf57 homolog [Sciurus carolinensis]|uniref:uncharacterized protein C9orf57 homolog n=1 Tax=Sciurus carolinensis TaxID=30640 RepID=UPI001FB4AACE|nr:uncharacterized protein C9orf57 homolog [Sciurus carolinensis]